MTHLTKLPSPEDAPWEPVPDEKIIAGAPRTRTIVRYENPAQKLSAGDWEASVGAWRVAYGEWEYVLVRSGRCIVTGDDGTRIEAGPGESFVIEPGFTGSWEVVEPMRKSWVVRD